MKVVKVKYKKRSVQFNILSMNVHKNGVPAKSSNNVQTSTNGVNTLFVEVFYVL